MEEGIGLRRGEGGTEEEVREKGVEVEERKESEKRERRNWGKKILVSNIAGGNNPLDKG